LICLRRTALVCSAVIAILLLNSCGGSGTTTTPTPVITSLSPDSATAGGPAFTLILSGEGFQSTSQVFWNGSCVTAAPPSTTCAMVTFNASSTQLSVSVPAAYIAQTGVPQVTVVNPFPGGPSLVAATFTISPANNPAPTVTSLAPSNTPVGTLPPGGTVTVNGTNFIATSTVTFNGNSRSTQFVSATQLTATVVASDVAAAGGINVQVSNPKPGGGVSAGATFTVGPVPAAIAHKAILSGSQVTPELISISAAGAAANGRSSTPATSADGRFVAFYSEATNLVARGASGTIFVRDTCNGAQNCTPQTIAIDLDVNGDAPSAPASEQVAISADGQFVAFSSSAANLVASSGLATPNAAQINEPRVYVRDLCEGGDVPAGCVPHTDLASIDPAGNSVSGRFSAISGDGRFVAFVSPSARVAAGETAEATRIYVRDTCDGPTANSTCAPKTIAVAANVASPEAADPLAISNDGRYVAFAASAGMDGSSSQQQMSVVRLADTCEGISAPAACTPQTVNVSIAPHGSLLPGNNSFPSVSGDGRFVVFQSSGAVSTDGSASSAPQIFLRDTCTGQTAPNGCAASTSIVASNATSPSIDAAGRYITFVAADPSQTGAAAAQTGALYISDTCVGAASACTPTTYPTAAAAVDSSTVVPISAAGSIVAFTSKAAQSLLPYDGLGDVYLIAIP
jgi:trimeric autotransporter adhesin